MNFDCKKMHPKCKASCCGVCPIPKETYNENLSELQRQPKELVHHMENVIPITEDAKCVFLKDDLNCAIYELRPDICRKFGDESHPMLICPYLDKNGKERGRQSKREAQRKIDKSMKKLMVLK